MGVLDVIRRHQVTLTLERPGAVSIVDGFAVEGAPTQSQIQAAIQPMSPEELRNVPEGQNTLDWRNVWSQSELRVRDQVIQSGRNFTIQRVEHWPEGGFYKAQAVAVDEQAGS